MHLSALVCSFPLTYQACFLHSCVFPSSTTQKRKQTCCSMQILVLIKEFGFSNARYSSRDFAELKVKLLTNCVILVISLSGRQSLFRKPKQFKFSTADTGRNRSKCSGIIHVGFFYIQTYGCKIPTGHQMEIGE